MSARLIVSALAIGLAVLATLAQLDQQARLTPAYAGLVPDDFSGNAARERSKLALAMGEPERSLAEARQQAALRPIPAESLTILALAALAAEDAVTGRKALEAASRRGWREPISQLASAQSAMDQGQLAVASQRIVALLSTQNLAEPARALLAQLVASPEGREQMAIRMSNFGRWQKATITSAAGVADPEDWAETVALALEKGADLPCSEVQRLSERYERTGASAAAAILMEADCPS